ncbi:hypothetical protein KGF56_001963 [Candida oxycetoniae]|uniref:L-type lectin-like domain-containing protein n=1 Tax=Candida oxycetoniae TaxID=497107 RepID=A0AAI9SZI4_9ASCO|nr:uncharacterized protein KGF56_001963 [Candida oxycetoniae]KAI3405219.2 hypothetical protein KGF56_001963 [Candida oxycetoniae]
MRFGISLVISAALSAGFVPNANLKQQYQQEQEALKISSQALSSISLPNLLEINGVDEIVNYDVSSGVLYDQGRLVMGKSGSIWSNANIPTGQGQGQAFTIEIVFRSSGKSHDMLFPDNKLALWLVDSSSVAQLNKYDGFKFMINNRDQQGLKIFNNDGSLENDDDGALQKSIGDCQFRYLESDVPFTLRVSYSDNNWFKVQIDNNLCFKTDRIQLPRNSNYKLGATSFINPQSQELFEILAVKVWDELTEDAIDDHGLMVDGELKIDVEQKVVDGDSQAQNANNLAARKSLMERERVQREQMEKSNGNTNNEQKESEVLSSDNTDLSSVIGKISNLESLLNDLLRSVPLIQSSTENSNREIAQQVQKTQVTLSELKQTFVEQYTELLRAVSMLNQKVIGEVREQNYGMEELGKKVDMLMNEHKEVQHQYQKQQNEEKEKNNAKTVKSHDSMADRLIKWILFPLMIVLLALVVFVYRLRHDIKHSKLL